MNIGVLDSVLTLNLVFNSVLSMKMTLNLDRWITRRNYLLPSGFTKLGDVVIRNIKQAAIEIDRV